MNAMIRSEPMTLDLEDCQLVSLVTHDAAMMIVESGVLWVTVEGEFRDRILRAGDCEPVPVDKKVVVQALQAARFAAVVRKCA